MRRRKFVMIAARWRVALIDAADRLVVLKHGPVLNMRERW
jgi:hypothetical protein